MRKMTIPTINDQGEKMCWTCGKSHEQLAREGVIPKHPFNDGSIPASETFGKRLASGDRTPPGGGPITPMETVVEAQWPWDPVLRQALINKGVLTPDDLQKAEAQIRAVTNQFTASGEGVST
jgi:hypothetical protein